MDRTTQTCLGFLARKRNTDPQIYNSWEPQSWHMIVPRLHQIQSLPSKDGGTCTSSPADILFREEMTWNAWHKLARPCPSTLKSNGRCSQSSMHLSSCGSCIETMPAELLAMVLNDSGLEMSDVICFGMASGSLWQHTLQHTRKECRSALAAPWAGVELACTGTYLTDLPNSFAEDNLAKSTVQIHHKSPCMLLARRINSAAIRSYDAPSEDPETAWQSKFEALRGAYRDIPEAQLKKMGDELRIATSNFCSESFNASWILRNLSTKEYVRCRPRACPGVTRGYVDYPEGHWLCLDDVLLMRICWTGEVSWNDKDDLIVSRRGKWAGHCFDIVALGGGEILSVGSGEWIDVTKDVVSEAWRLRHRMGWGVRLRAR